MTTARASVVLGLALALAAPLAAAADTGRFLQVSDIHFSPFVPALRAKPLATTAVEDWWPILAADPDTALAQWGSDTNHALFATALSAIADAAADADFVVVTGDLLAHNFPANVESVFGFAPGSAANDAFAVRTTLFVADSLRSAIPGKPIFVTLGNNDSSCGDYRIEPNGAYLAATRETVRRLAGADRVAADFDETYLAGGYYAAAHPTLADTTIIVLDDVLWSIDYQNACGTTGLSGADAMMAWLEKQLADARAAGRKVWLAHHIPVGFDPYATLHGKQATCAERIRPMLAEPYAAKYVGLLSEYAATVTIGLVGHTHFDDFRLLRDKGGAVVGIEKIAPAISPIFGQNPGFHVYSYDRAKGAITDLATHYLANLATAASPAEADWKQEYVYSEAYGVPDFSPASAETVWKQFASEGEADDLYRKLYNVSHGELSADGIKAYACAIGHADEAGFATCYCGG